MFWASRTPKVAATSLPCRHYHSHSGVVCLTSRGGPEWHGKKIKLFATNYFFLSECKCNVNGTLNLNETICDKSTGVCGPCKIGFFGEKCENGIILFFSQKWYFVYKIVLIFCDKKLF